MEQRPQVLYFAEGEEVSSYTLDQIQSIYRWVSQTAFCFMIEFNETLIGECWLQQMNLERILHKYPKADSRRIDLMIGVKELWGQGLGTEVIQRLSAFARPRIDAREVHSIRSRAVYHRP